MQAINKKRAHEPTSLRLYRETTDAASYTGLPSDVKRKIKDVLLKSEQFYLCAYCLGKIEVSSATIEHYSAQNGEEENSEEEDLSYMNMLAVCAGNCKNKQSKIEQHCDKARGNKTLQFIDPREKSKSEAILTYSSDGRILPNKRKVVDEELRSKIEEDLKALNLNAACLVSSRQSAKEAAQRYLDAEAKKEEWSVRDIEKAIEKWETLKKGAKPAHYLYVVLYLKKKLKAARRR
ncbi:TIGR02646 family protein [Saprospira grandis DSM 2844]|uniref:TIGR02646 family protein n=1 Tax=Saprospira grandis DSM 2844 TaxID=694433 RepID=J0XZQ6_9BACT|nr:retron system putative HNH endonuclease [Saprospira grandis]EJF54686.1 TIGR02646 family protein [Saprospira grandis DSM 2844]